MNTEIIIHTGEYAGGIEDGEILFQKVRCYVFLYGIHIS